MVFANVHAFRHRYPFIATSFLLLAEIAGGSGKAVKRYAVFKWDDRRFVATCCWRRGGIRLVSKWDMPREVFPAGLITYINIGAFNAAPHIGFIDVQNERFQLFGT